ncbi:MAG: hypothetical protein ACD_79C01302G0020 [uncultured bacterium]|nr:MAG: hypothetical protein ACD_79C01302G0020 [uncultured bacterium]
MKIRRVIFLSVNQSFFDSFLDLLKSENIENYFVLRDGIKETLIEEKFGHNHIIPYKKEQYIQLDLQDYLNDSFDEAIIMCRDVNVDLSWFSKFIFIVASKAKRIFLCDISGRKKELNYYSILYLKIKLYCKSLYQKKIKFYAQKVSYKTFSFIAFSLASLILLILSPILRLYGYLIIKVLKRSFKVCIAKRVISNQPYLLSKGLKELGINAFSVELCEHVFLYDKCDYRMFISKRIPFLRFFLLLSIFTYCFIKSDVFIFSVNGECFFVSPLFQDWELSLLFQKIELILYKIAGKKVIFQMRDCSVYNRDMALQLKNRNRCKHCSPEIEKYFCRNIYYREVTKTAIKFASKIIYSTADLKAYVPGNSDWLPNAIEIKESSYHNNNDNGKLKIIHSSTNVYAKGTGLVCRVIEKLKFKYKIDFEILNGRSQKEVFNIIENADIVVGQFTVGAYGNFEIEAMMMKKPVVGYINPEYIPNIYDESIPIVNVDENNIEESLYEKIEQLILNQNLREKIGSKGYEYVNKIHDYRIVSKKLLSIINNLYER